MHTETNDFILSLAIETSGRTGSVALAEDGRVIAEAQFPHGLQHAAGIIPMIDGLCRRVGGAPRQIGRVCVSAGPGSFTGLRIGITLAKTMAFATGTRIVAVPTVRVLAQNAPADARHVILVLDAKRGQIYTALLVRSADGWIEREGAHLDTLSAMLARASRPVHLLGDGIPFHQSAIPEGDPSIVLTNPDLWRPRACVVAQIGDVMARAGEYADPYRLTPIYIRPPEAEEKYAAQHAQSGAGQ